MVKPQHGHKTWTLPFLDIMNMPTMALQHHWSFGEWEKIPPSPRREEYWIHTPSTVEPLGINKRTEFVMFPWILTDVCFGTFCTFSLFNSTKSQKALNTCIFNVSYIYHILEMLVFKLLAIFVILTSTWTLTIATPTHSLSNRFETLLNQLSHDNCKPDLGNLNVFFHSGSDGQPFVAQLNV